MEDELLPISALQHYAYCPRQFALIHIEQAWEENRYTAEGRLLHERVDSSAAEQRGALRYERSVMLLSQQYGLTGKMDLLEIEKNGEVSKYFPVEYKRGKPKVEDWDRIQLCAQALCIEEMKKNTVAEGAIWYWEVRKREPVVIDIALRQTTEEAIGNAKSLLREGLTPPPISEKKRCKACSLANICEPNTFRIDHSVAYVKELFSSEGDAE
jgi:CRISPR-associated exonuclease Cas4